MIIRCDISDDRLLVGSLCVDVLGIEQARYTELGISDVERIIEIVDVLALSEFRPIDKIRPVGVDEGVEAETASPRTYTLETHANNVRSEINN